MGAQLPPTALTGSGKAAAPDARMLPCAGSPRLLAVSCSVLLDGALRWRPDEMSKTGQKVLDEALQLDLPERAELAAELLASLDGEPDADVEAAWAAEIERRATRARSGEDAGRPWAEARDSAKDALRRR
jgi:hypothetical protein